MSIKEISEQMAKYFCMRNLIKFLREKDFKMKQNGEPTVLNLTIRQKNDNRLDGFFDTFSEPSIVGHTVFPDETSFPVFFIDLRKGTLTERSSRKKQFDYAKKILLFASMNSDFCGLPAPCAHGIFVFADKMGHARMSLIEDIGKANSQKRYRRYTFYIDPEATNRTFIDRMCMDWSSFDKIKEAFSVERLNKEFYSKLSDWYFWALNRVHFPGSDNKEDNAVPLIRMITRLIFVWFMKQKGLIPNELFQKDSVVNILKSMDDDDSSYYKAILQNLFFATLNTEMNDPESRIFRKGSNAAGYNEQYQIFSVYRYENMFTEAGKKTFLAMMKNIPFLNGGLFSCLDDENLLIDCFSDNPNHSRQLSVPNELFWIEESNNYYLDLSKVYDDRTKKRELLQGLIPLLASYNFTIDESSPNDATIALDPELLGRIFENLLASYNPETATTARKQTGSFYTPREIVDYMVEKSLTQHILTFSEKQGVAIPEEDIISLISPDDMALSQSIITNKKLITQAIEKCTILDPACGSGAFPMGLLSAFIRVLGKINPVKDDTDLYNRKLKLIQNCIYGVDIQPIAVQISKLRCFISLLADDDINENEANRGIEPLPNLEMHFVAANSLIDIEGPGADSFISPKTEKIKRDMQDTAQKLFSVKKRVDKKKLQKKYMDLRDCFIESLSSDFDTHDYVKIAEWDPFNQMESSSFFNPEWMFGIKDGFDIVIGNPPYVFARDSKKKGITADEKAAYYKKYELAKYQINLYSLFIERGTNLLSGNGVFSYIIPNNWLTINTNKDLREFILSKDSITVVNFYKRVFESADVDSSIVVYRNKRNSEALISLYEVTDEKQLHLIKKETASFFLKQKDYIISIGILNNDSYINLVEKIESNSSPLSSFSLVKAGLKAYEVGKGTPKQTEIMKESRVYHSKVKVDDSFFKYVDGKDVKRYSFSWQKQEYLKYGKNLAAPRKNWDLFSSPRILVRQIPSKPPYCICANYTKETFLNDLNSMNVINITKNPLFVLGVINSKAVSFWFIHKFGKMQRAIFPQFKVNELAAFPIPDTEQDIQNSIASLVSARIEACEQSSADDEQRMDSEIDELVYLAYGLTKDEISVIEDSLSAVAQETKPSDTTDGADILKLEAGNTQDDDDARG